MTKEKKFGLLGKTLKHSYSKTIHGLLGDYGYGLYEVEENELKEAVDGLDGFNVTIPYKTEIIKYLDIIDDSAKDIGAVNTVIKKDGKTFGYNTDFYGMKYMLNYGGIDICGKNVMILGSGGTSKTAEAVCKSLGAKNIVKVSRNGEINYSNYKELKNTEVIINTTPVGTFPNNYDCVVDISAFDNLEGVADVVYNPNTTLLCFNAKSAGIKAINGLSMLVAQAKYAKDLFTGCVADDFEIKAVYDRILKDKLNVVLVGMPGSGKTSVGKEVANILGREFIDTDAEIEKKAKKSIPEIFEENGEEYFRALESETIKEICKLTGKVIATGGGAVVKKENLYPLSSNGKIFWIKRDIESLALSGRPLSKNAATVEALYAERKDKYAAFADKTVFNDGDIKDAANEIAKEFLL